MAENERLCDIARASKVRHLDKRSMVRVTLVERNGDRIASRDFLRDLRSKVIEELGAEQRFDAHKAVALEGADRRLFEFWYAV